MDVDPEIKKFSSTVFSHIYYEMFDFPKPKGYKKIKSSKTEVFGKVVLCRQVFFGDIYERHEKESYEIWKDSAVKFYNHVVSVFTNFNEYLCPNVFDKILILCAYIIYMAVSCHGCGNKLYLSFPACFAQYLDSFHKAEFFSQGMWEGLDQQLSKYYTICSHTSDLIGISKLPPRSDAFINALETEIKTDCHLEHLLKLVREHALKYKNGNCICRKCLSYCDLGDSFIEDLKSNEILKIERFFQICLNLMECDELDSFKKKVADDLEHRHANCKVGTSSKFIEPCLKCYIPIDRSDDEHANQKISTNADIKPIFLKKAVAQEIYKRMFMDNRVKSIEQQVLCASCFQTVIAEIQEPPKESVNLGNSLKPLVEHNRVSVIVKNPYIYKASINDLNIAANIEIQEKNENSDAGVAENLIAGSSKYNVVEQIKSNDEKEIRKRSIVKISGAQNAKESNDDENCEKKRKKK